MTVVKRTVVRSRLSQMIDTAGGVSVGAALKDAQSRLADLEPQSREHVRATVAELTALTRPAQEADLPAALERAYALASGVLDAAGMFDNRALCAAAASLCDLIDGDEADFDWRVVPVHAQAMSLILSLPPEADDARQRILDGLGDIRARKLAAN